MYTPANPSSSIKVGFKGVFISWTCFPDEKYLSSKHFSGIGMIREELVPDRYLNTSLMMILSTLPVLSRIGCLSITVGI